MEEGVELVGVVVEDGGVEERFMAVAEARKDGWVGRDRKATVAPERWACVKGPVWVLL